MYSLRNLLRIVFSAILIAAILLPAAPAHAQTTATIHYHRPDGA